ncbi:MAG: YdcF family protein [Cyanobacteria bacterium P01_F01_bin.150]
MQDITDIWASFTWSLFDWLSSPNFIIPACLSIITLTFFISKKLWVKCIQRGIVLFLTLYLALSTSWIASLLVKGLTSTLPDITNESADAIVVLSRDEELGDSRYQLAAKLLEEKRAPRLFVTTLGGIGQITESLENLGLDSASLQGVGCAKSKPEKDYMRYLISSKLGEDRVHLTSKSQFKSIDDFFNEGRQNSDSDEVIELTISEVKPPPSLSKSICSRTTYEEAIATRKVLNIKGIKTIFIVTDRPHMLRAKLVFQSVNFTVFPYSDDFPSQLSSLKRSLLALREYIGLINYSLLGRT